MGLLDYFTNSIKYRIIIIATTKFTKKNEARNCYDKIIIDLIHCTIIKTSV